MVAIGELIDLVRDGATLEAIDRFEQGWVELGYRADCADVRRFLETVPIEEVESRVGLRFAAVHCRFLTGERARAAVERAAREAREPGAGDADVVLAGLLAAAWHRSEGDYLRARIDLDELVTVLERLDTATPRPAVATFARVQLGMAALLAGDLAGARRWWRSVLDQGAQTSLVAAVESAGLLSLVLAVAGEGAEADRLLDGVDAELGGRPMLSTTAADARYLARAVRALDRGDLAVADRMVRARQPASFGELWPLALWTHAQYLLLTGRYARGLRLVEQAEAEQPPGASGNGVAGDVLAAARADFHVGLGNLREAWVSVEASGHRGPWSAIAEVAVLYGSGEHEAVRYAARVARSSHDLTLRDQVRLRGLEAAAGLAQGLVSLVDDLLAELITVATEQRWATVVAHLPVPLAARATAAGLPGLASSGEVLVPWVPAPVLSAALSPREQEVFQLVLAGESREAIAAALGVSINTVKTQIRHVYAKYGVAGRVELMQKVALLPPSWSYEAISPSTRTDG